MGHVHLQDYYFATVLAQLQHWLIPYSKALWTEIEQTQISKGSLRDFLMTAHLNTSLENKLAPPILASIRAWIQLRNYPNSSGTTLPLKLPISAHSQLIPDINLSTWRDKGIHYMEDILDATSIKTFNTLISEFQLPTTEQYKHIQISQLLNKKPHILTILPKKITQYYL